MKIIQHQRENQNLYGQTNCKSLPNILKNNIPKIEPIQYRLIKNKNRQNSQKGQLESNMKQPIRIEQQHPKSIYT